jgi:hypothetical protein
MNPKEQVQAMLERAKQLTEEKKKQEELEKEKILLQTVSEPEEVQLPSLYEPIASLSLVEDATETREGIIARFSIDPDNYKNLKLNADSAKRIKKAVGKMTTGAAASVPISCRGDTCSYKERCLDGDTLVLVDGFKTKKIKDIVIGDKVYSANKEFSLERKPVLGISKSHARAIYTITTESGLVINATANHPFAFIFDTDQVEWLTLEDGLSEGHKILVVDTLDEGSYFTDSVGDCFVDTIQSVKFNKIDTVYDITVSENANFIANSILVHNCPFYKEDVAPVGEPCLVEVTIAEYWTKKYMEDLNINPNSITEVLTVSRLVEIAILENRLTMYMAIHDQDLTMDFVTSVDPEGNEIHNKASSIAFEQRERLDKSRLKILESLAATRDKQMKLQLGLQSKAAESANLVNIRQSLDQLALDVKAMNVVSDQ